ncbi:MAG: 3D domain-containing protein [Bacillota bacterium]|nr:3D domain-containing protein [Bacillota bacterium]MDP4161148.1 3D domain-containing protein [Bacillota bacterium]
MKRRRILLTFMILFSSLTTIGVHPVANDNLQQTTRIDIEENKSDLTKMDLVKLAAVRDAQSKQTMQVSRGSAPEKKLIGEFKLSFYTPSPDETDDSPLITATGARVKPGITVAVDPRYWKMGTKFYIEGYGYVIAEDTGSMIKGPNVMDVCVETKDQAFKNGIQFRKVWVVKA